nr:hypothetical protein [Mangrovibacter yixingensis]
MKELTLTISLADLRHLEHLRNVGLLIGELMQAQDCASSRPDPAQQAQLTSVIHLMTARLDDMVERCNERWLTEDVRA